MTEERKRTPDETQQRSVLWYFQIPLLYRTLVLFRFLWRCLLVWYWGITYRQRTASAILLVLLPMTLKVGRILEWGGMAPEEIERSSVDVEYATGALLLLALFLCLTWQNIFRYARATTILAGPLLALFFGMLEALNIFRQPTFFETETSNRLARLAITLATVPLLGIIWVLRTMTAKEYAVKIISGRKPADGVRVLAQHSAVACARSLFCLEIAATADSLRRQTLYGRELRRAKRHKLRMRKAIARLLEMKVVFAKENRLQRRKVCDYLLRYSPLMHDDRLARYITLRTAIIRDPDTVALIEPLIEGERSIPQQVHEEIDRLRRETRLRFMYLAKLMSHRDLHPLVVRIGSARSMTRAVSEYAAAITEAALAGGNLRDKLRFIGKKQRVYVGIDPRDTLTRLWLQRSLPLVREQSGLPEHRFKFILRVILDKDVCGLTDRIEEELMKVGVSKSDINECRAGIYRKDAMAVKTQVSLAIDSQGQMLQKEFVKFFRLHCKAHGVVVIHSYSGTLRGALGQLEEEDVKSLQVLFLASNQEDEFAARLMRQELAQAGSWISRRAKIVGVDLARGVILDSLSRSEGDEKVWFFMGCSAFTIADDNKDAATNSTTPIGVAYLSNSVTSLGKLYDDFRESVGVAVVAQEYKKVAIESLVNHSFSERIEAWPHVHRVVTENGCYGPDEKNGTQVTCNSSTVTHVHVQQ